MTAVPPRRLSAIYHDPDWSIEATRPNLRVFVDGVKIEMCLSYDQDAGTVHRLVLNSAGGLAIKDGCTVVEILSGEVTVDYEGPKN